MFWKINFEYFVTEKPTLTAITELEDVKLTCIAPFIDYVTKYQFTKGTEKLPQSDVNVHRIPLSSLDSDAYTCNTFHGDITSVTSDPWSHTGKSWASADSQNKTN